MHHFGCSVKLTQNYTLFLHICTQFFSIFLHKLQLPTLSSALLCPNWVYGSLLIGLFVAVFFLFWILDTFLFAQWTKVHHIKLFLSCWLQILSALTGTFAQTGSMLLAGGYTAEHGVSLHSTVHLLSPLSYKQSPHTGLARGRCCLEMGA